MILIRISVEYKTDSVARWTNKLISITKASLLFRSVRCIITSLGFRGTVNTTVSRSLFRIMITNLLSWIRNKNVSYLYACRYKLFVFQKARHFQFKCIMKLRNLQTTELINLIPEDLDLHWRKSSRERTNSI